MTPTISLSHNVWRITVSSLLTGSMALSGCAMVKVNSKPSPSALVEQRDSVLSRGRLSEASLNVLSMTGQSQEPCLDSLESCITTLQKIPELASEQYLSTVSELYLTRALNNSQSTRCQAPIVNKVPVLNSILSKNQLKHPQQQPAATPDLTAMNDCKQKVQADFAESLRYSYAYLFFSSRKPEQRIFDNRQVQVRDFYNMAGARLIQGAYDSFLEQLKKNPTQAASYFTLGNMHLTIHNYSQALKDAPLPQQIYSANDLNFSGLRSINRRDGFGIEFVSVLPDAPSSTDIATHSSNKTLDPALPNPSPTPAPKVASLGLDDKIKASIHASHYLPVSLVLKINGTTLKDILTSQDMTLDVYDPYKTPEINVLEQPYSLAANYSAPYGLWLAQTDLAQLAYTQLLGDWVTRFKKVDSRPQLYMLEPYTPNKRVIVLIHGLASSPEAWISLTNDIFGDPILRNGYQVWQIFYPTNLPILESRYEINQLLRATYKQTDPTGQHKSSQNTVLIGHSMGGIISRLLVSNTELTSPALERLSERDRKRLLAIPEVRAHFKLEPLPQVSRAIFVSAPFQGSELADKWYTRALRRFVQLPGMLIHNINNTILTRTYDEAFVQRIGQAGVLDFQNGPSELSKKSEFVAMTRQVEIDKKVPFHLIMGREKATGDLLTSSDGIVPYTSSHLEGAASEKVIIGGHSIQETPEAVLELRRILRLHLQTIGDMPANTAQPAIPFLLAPSVEKNNL